VDGHSQACSPEDVLADFPCRVTRVEPLSYVCADPTQPPHLFRVETDEGPLFLKRHQRGRGPRTLLIPQLVEHLFRHGFRNTPRMHRSLHGGFFVRRGEDLWSLSDWVELRPFLDEPTWEDLLASAELLARMHRASRGFRAWPKKPSVQEWLRCCRRPLRTFAAFEARRLPGSDVPEYREVVLGILSAFREEAEHLARASQQLQGTYQAVCAKAASERGFVHHDMGPLNLQRAGSEQVLIDWDSWKQGLRWDNDLWFLVRVAHDEALIRRVLGSYHRVQPIPQEEAQLVPLLYSPAFELDWVLRDEWAVRHKMRFLRQTGMTEGHGFTTAVRERLACIAQAIDDLPR
jgi:Ser/Thr protein kinase RdoA (MazF antagonist)